MRRICLLLGTGLWLVPTPAAAQAPSSTDTRAAAQPAPATVTTHATARRRLPNTIADVTVGVKVDGPTVADVEKHLAKGAQTLTAYLRGAGAERLRTELVTVEPMRDVRENAGVPGQITGYTGTVGVSFRTTAERLPELLSGSLEHGGNSLEQTGLAPREEELDAARQDLAATATRTALAQAKAIAKAVGRSVRGVRQIVVDPDSGMPPMRSFRAYAAAAPAAAPMIPTEAGDVEVTATVTVTATLAE